MAEVILAAESLTYHYPGGVAALNGLTLTVRRGARLALLGANGSGKSTLFLHLNGTLRPQAGRVCLDGAAAGYDRRALKRWRSRVGLVLQDPDDQLFAATVWEDVSFGPLNLGLPEDEVRRRLEATLQSLSIAALAGRPTHMLSFGQKRRVALAGLLALGPDVLLLDEPMAGLDPESAAQLRSILDRLSAAGTTLVLSTHDVEFARDWADEAAILQAGTVLAQGAPDSLLTNRALMTEARLGAPRSLPRPAHSWPNEPAAANPEPAAIVLCGHGSRHADGADEFRAVAAAVRGRLPLHEVSHAFLELAQPLLPARLAQLATEGHRRIVVVPCMLFAAGHAKSDIPALIAAFRTTHPGVEVIYGRTFGIDPHLLDAAKARIVPVLDERVPRNESLLLVIGRGCSDFDANGSLVKVMRLLWESLGFGWGEVGFFDVTFPHLEVAIDHATRMGYRRIVVFPYLLFNGVLVRRLRRTLTEARRRHPDLDIVEAPYLNDHPGVIDVFTERAEEALAASAGPLHPDPPPAHPFADHPNGPLSIRRWSPGRLS